MGRAGVAYSSGFKAIMTAVPYLLGMLIFSGFAGRISAVGTSFNITSIPDLFERRFGKATKVTLGALIAFTMMGTVAAQVTVTATIINMLGGEIGVSYEMGAFIACAVFIIYTATSGLFGVIYTDVFQFVMLILFVYIMIPTASLAKLGGLSVFLENLAPELSTPYVDGSIIGILSRRGHQCDIIATCLYVKQLVGTDQMNVCTIFHRDAVNTFRLFRQRFIFAAFNLPQFFTKGFLSRNSLF